MLFGGTPERSRSEVLFEASSALHNVRFLAEARSTGRVAPVDNLAELGAIIVLVKHDEASIHHRLHVLLQLPDHR